MKRKHLPWLAVATLLAFAPTASFAQDDLVLDDNYVPSDYNDDFFDTSDVEIVDTSDAPLPIDLNIIPEVPEGGRIEYSVGELQMLISSQGTAILREFQEDPTRPRGIFETAEEAKRILGNQPRLIYFPEGPDPMIIPWIRERVVAEELYQEAVLARTNRDFEKAKALLREIQENYPNTAEAQKAPADIAAIDQQIAAEARAMAQADSRPEPVTPIGPQDVVIQLPEWIKQNTNGIMLRGNGEHRVVVANDFLGVGESVPRFQQVTVKAITESEVVYLFENREFVLEVDGAL